MKLNNYQPLWRQIVVKPLLEEKTEGGIYIPVDSVKEETRTRFRVISIGPQCLEVKPGDEVLLDSWSLTNKQLVKIGEDNIPQYSVGEQNVIGRYTR